MAESLAKIPRHVAVIMDGNGRWAGERGLPRLAGHRAGTENIRRVIECFAEHRVEYLTLYAFSTENWTRPAEEVQGLMNILSEVIHRETENLHRKGARLRHLGRLEGLSKDLQQAVRYAVDLTCHNTRINVNVAFNYGGRAEILDAVRHIVQKGITADQVDEESFSTHLYTHGMPDPDLIVRTGGEMRLSNFLIWQAAYAEYYATSVYWPDFDEKCIALALAAYSQRKRRFGGLNREQV